MKIGYSFCLDVYILHVIPSTSVEALVFGCASPKQQVVKVRIITSLRYFFICNNCWAVLLPFQKDFHPALEQKNTPLLSAACWSSFTLDLRMRRLESSSRWVKVEQSRRIPPSSSSHWSDVRVSFSFSHTPAYSSSASPSGSRRLSRFTLIRVKDHAEQWKPFQPAWTHSTTR